MWIGWASSVKLWSSQTSVAPTSGNSVGGSSQPSGFPLPSALSVPRSASAGAKGSPPAQSRTMLPPSVLTLTVADSGSLSDSSGLGSPLRAAPAQAGRAATAACSGRGPAGDDVEAHHLAGGRRVRRLEVDAQHPAPERLVRGDIEHVNRVPTGTFGEVDDHVGALGRAEQHLCQLDRLGQEAALVADLPERQPVLQPQDQEARVAAVQESEAVPPLLRLSLGQVRPLTTIALPKNSGFQIGATSLGPPQAGSPRTGSAAGTDRAPRRKRGCPGRRARPRR